MAKRKKIKLLTKHERLELAGEYVDTSASIFAAIICMQDMMIDKLNELISAYNKLNEKQGTKNKGI